MVEASVKIKFELQLVFSFLAKPIDWSLFASYHQTVVLRNTYRGEPREGSIFVPARIVKGSLKVIREEVIKHLDAVIESCIRDSHMVEELKKDFKEGKIQ